MEKLLNVENDLDGEVDCSEVMGRCCLISEVSTDYVQVTHAARSSGRNGNTSMETHVYAVSRQKIPRTCCNVPSLHDPASWMTFQSSTTQ